MIGELIEGSDRLVLAPHTGRYVADVDDLLEPARLGALVMIGAPLGGVVSLGHTTVVTTPFTGVLAGLLVLDGERVRAGQPVAWLRVA